MRQRADKTLCCNPSILLHQKMTCEIKCILPLLCILSAIQKHSKNILHDKTYTQDVKKYTNFY